MAKISNNPIMKGLSGMLGDVVVYSERRGKMIMSNRPKKSGQLTDHQKGVKAKFLQAVQYAKGQMLDPEARAEYEAAVTNKMISGYAVAVSDYLKGPEITSVDVSGYAGLAGNEIVINAIDNFKVTGVTVEIRSAAGVLIEQGAAVQDPGNVLFWRFAATRPNSTIHGTRVIVSVKDKPNNVTTRDVVVM